MSINDQLVIWLHDAYSMELGVGNMLSVHLEQAEEFPGLRRLLQQHLVDTRRHAEEMKSCLRLVGADVPMATDGITKAGILFRDAFLFRTHCTVENTIIELATAHFEISAYISLIAAATDLGEREIVEICENILEEEESMADHLMVQLPEITSTYLEVLFLQGRQSLHNARGSNYFDTPFALKHNFTVPKPLRTAATQGCRAGSAEAEEALSL